MIKHRMRKKFQPRYLEGKSGKFLASFYIFDAGHAKIYSIDADPSDQDARAIYSDWKMVGEDIKAGIRQYDKEVRRQ